MSGSFRASHYHCELGNPQFSPSTCKNKFEADANAKSASHDNSSPISSRIKRTDTSCTNHMVIGCSCLLIEALSSPLVDHGTGDREKRCKVDELGLG